MAKKSGLVVEGRPTEEELGRRAWIRLIVREPARQEDEEAEELFTKFAEAIASSEYKDKYVLSIFRISADKEANYDVLPKIENEPGYPGIDEVKRFLERNSRDVRIPIVS